MKITPVEPSAPVAVPEKQLCPVCQAYSWRNLDALRTADRWYEEDVLKTGEPVGFQVCEGCGFLTYAWRGSEEALREFYRNQYRTFVAGHNHVTCNRKNIYHRAFLGEWLGERRPGSDVRDERSVLDVGCAQGAFLKMLHDDYRFRKGGLDGTEWTVGFRKFACDEFELNVTEDADESKRYDMIALYHVLEHLRDPRKELLKYRGMLKAGGVLYISHPLWSGPLECGSGAVGVLPAPDLPPSYAFEELYHLNHCNVFSLASARNLLASCGLVVVRENLGLYGYTYIAKPGEVQAITPEPVDEVVVRVETQKRAIEKMAAQVPAEAILLYPEYPDAHIAAAYYKENFREEAGQKRVLDAALEKMPNDPKLLRQRAICELQWSEAKSQPGTVVRYNNAVRRAEELMAKANAVKPHSEMDLHTMALLAYTYKREPLEAIELWKRGIEINPGKWMEFMNYIGHARAGNSLPVPFSPPNVGKEAKPPTNAVSMVAQPKLAGLRGQMGIQ